MDRLNSYLDGNFKRDLQSIVSKIENIKHKLAALGYTLVGDEPMKIAIKAKPYGYTGDALASLLQEEGVYSEFFDSDYLVLMPSAATTDEELERLFAILSSVKKGEPILDSAPSFAIPERVTSPREASMSPSVLLPISECVGRVLSETSVFCPPAVPIIVSGERVSERIISALKYYGIDSLRVIRE